MSKRKASIFGYHEVAVKPYVGTWEEFVQGAKQIYMRSPEKVRAAFFVRLQLGCARATAVAGASSRRSHAASLERPSPPPPLADAFERANSRASRKSIATAMALSL